MKKLLLGVTFMASTAFADMSSFTINKSEIDFSKDDLIYVNFTLAHYESTNYQLYKNAAGEIFLDFTAVADAEYTTVRTKHQVPITLKPLLGTYLNAGYEEAEVILNVREVNAQNVAIQAQQFKIKIVDTRKDNSVAISDPTGAWYQPSLDGFGFYIQQLKLGSGIQYYGYTDLGELLWLISDLAPDAWSKGQKKELTMYKGSPDSATHFHQPPKKAPGISKWGTLSIQFDSCSSAKATLSGEDGEQTFDLQKIAGPNNIQCIMHTE